MVREFVWVKNLLFTRLDDMANDRRIICADDKHCRAESLLRRHLITFLEVAHSLPLASLDSVVRQRPCSRSDSATQSLGFSHAVARIQLSNHLDRATTRRDGAVNATAIRSISRAAQSTPTRPRTALA